MWSDTPCARFAPCCCSRGRLRVPSRRAAPLQNGYFTANKQFISWLPIPEPPSSDLEHHGHRLYEIATAIEQERSAFLDWLASVCGTPLKKLNGGTKLEAYPRLGRDAVLDVLDNNAVRLKIDPRSWALLMVSVREWTPRL